MSRPSGFTLRLALIVGAALAIRIAAAIISRDHGVQGDALTFHILAQHLADGEGFRRPFEDAATAEHPPLWPSLLALADLVGANGYLAHRLVGALIGTVTVAAIGVLGRAVAGATVGLVAAGLAAVYPMLWSADVSLMSEPLYGLLLVAALLVALRLRGAPTVRTAALVGALIGLAALVRGEALLLLGVLALPMAYLVAGTWRRRATLAGAAIVAALLVLGPWTVRNLATFEKPVLISTNANAIWVGANCADTYYGELVGYWAFRCYTPTRPGEDESEWTARQQETGMRYARDHLGRLPAVIPRRVARTLDVGYVGQSLFINSQEGRTVRATRWGIGMAWGLMLLSIAGVVLLRRRGAPLAELLAPLAMVALVTVVFYGTTRFRFAAEPVLCVLAATTLVAVAGRFAPRLRRPAAPARA